MVRFLFIAFALLAFSCSPTNQTVGGACSDDRDCKDRCLKSWPGGFCTVDCRDDRDCPSDTVCSDRDGGVCLLLCDDNRWCRDTLDDNDYKCDDVRNRDDRDIRDDVCVPD